MWGRRGARRGMPAGMILGFMATRLGGAILITGPIGAGAAITPASTRLGMILGIMVASTVAIGAATGVVIGAAIGAIITIIRPITRRRCAIMPTGVRASTIRMRVAEAAA